MKITKNSGKREKTCNIYMIVSPIAIRMSANWILNFQYSNNLVFLTDTIGIYHNSSAHVTPLFFRNEPEYTIFCLFHPAEKGDSLHLVYTAYTRLTWKRFLSYMKIFRLILLSVPTIVASQPFPPPPPPTQNHAKLTPKTVEGYSCTPSKKRVKTKNILTINFKKVAGIF